MKRRREALCFATGSGVLAVALAACGDDDNRNASSDAGLDSTAAALDSGAAPEGDAAATTQAVTVSFRAVVGSEPFSCASTYTGLGSSNSTVRPADFRFYVHDLTLGSMPLTLTADGKWQLENVGLLDFEDKSGECTDGTVDLNSDIKGTVPIGTHKGLSFKVGVPFALDHANQATAKSPLTLTQLFWDWQSGYKFAKIDAIPYDATDAGLTRWNIHIGSTACDGDPADGGTVTSCGHANVASYTFPDFDPATQVVQIDYRALVAGTDFTVNPDPVPGCMSQGTDLGPQCPAIFAALGLSMDTGLPVDGQTVFTAVAR